MRAGKTLKNGEIDHFRPIFDRQPQFLEVLADLTTLSRRITRRRQPKENKTKNNNMKTNNINLQNTQKYG